MATSLAQILALSGINPKDVDLPDKTLYGVVHVTPSGETLKGKAAVAAAQSQQKEASQAAPSYRIKMEKDTEAWLAKFITCDTAMCIMKDKVRRLADLPYPVLIHGETGTGKELIAKALHSKRTGNFVDINCGGFPEHLIESELFGHVAGAFTGADKDKQGLFQAAASGTLFLDEIGELPMLMQCKLLRALQENVVRRVGSVNNEQVTCRVVAASHCNLRELVKQGKFREDLLWRLNTFELFISPLRERKKDVMLITKALGMELSYDSLYAPADIEPSNRLSGNVRELQQLVLRRKYNI